MSKNAKPEDASTEDVSTEKASAGKVSSEQLIIIGSGPAGYTAAIYAARAGLSPLVLAGSVTAGGALMNTTEVENFPGFPAGVQGPELMDGLQQQAEKFGAQVVFDDATSFSSKGHLKRVVTGGGETYEAPAVILATGSAYKELGLAEEKKFSGHGVSWCATCDGFFFRDQDIIVVGGGDSAMEEATFLTRFGKSVTVVVRKGELRASRIMAQRAKDNPKITFAWNSAVTGIHGDGKVSGVTLTNPHRRNPAAAGHGAVRGDRPRAAHRAGGRAGGARRRGLHQGGFAHHVHQPERRVRLRGRRGPPLPAGDHRRRHRLRGGTRRRALPRRAGGCGQHRHGTGGGTHTRLNHAEPAVVSLAAGPTT